MVTALPLGGASVAAVVACAAVGAVVAWPAGAAVFVACPAGAVVSVACAAGAPAVFVAPGAAPGVAFGVSPHALTNTAKRIKMATARKFLLNMSLSSSLVTETLSER